MACDWVWGVGDSFSQCDSHRLEQLGGMNVVTHRGPVWVPELSGVLEPKEKARAWASLGILATLGLPSPFP